MSWPDLARKRNIEPWHLPSELVWIKQILGDLGIKSEYPIKMFYDNNAAKHIASNAVFHERTKHIDIRYHFVRDVISEGKAVMKKVDTEKNPADMLTKPLPVVKFEFCSKSVSVCV